jgi:hypothetical protein
MPGMLTNRFKLLTISLVAAALLPAACGDDDSGDATAADPRAEFREAAVDYAQCMRENGVDMPDPDPNAPGIQLRSPPGTDRATMERAQEACQEILDKARPPELSAEEQSEFRERALEQAQCMREHGIDMPDPTFDGGGVRMQLPPGSREDPAFQEAVEECMQQLGGSGGPGQP